MPLSGAAPTGVVCRHRECSIHFTTEEVDQLIKNNSGIPRTSLFSAMMDVPIHANCFQEVHEGVDKEANLITLTIGIAERGGTHHQ
jgi:hypothetical protein